MRTITCIAILATTLSASANTNAGILGGNPTVERTTADGAENALFFDFTNPILADGTIDSWRIYASSVHYGPGGPYPGITSNLAQLKLKIFRDVGSTWEFIGESPLETVISWADVNTFTLPTPIEVQAGDLIAWYYPTGTMPSIAYSRVGTAMVNANWPENTLDDINYDIPDLTVNPDWGGHDWNMLTRTYSIEVLGNFLVSLPGDLNADGYVNSADLDIVREHWNETVTAGDLAMGDATGDGFVGSGDLDTVRANWGESLFAAAVPEPGVLSLSLLAMGVFGLVGRFRRP